MHRELLLSYKLLEVDSSMKVKWCLRPDESDLVAASLHLLESQLAELGLQL